MTRIRIVLVTLALLLVAAVAWNRIATQRAADHHDRREALESLRRNAAAVDALSLSARFGTLNAYDPLVKAFRDLHADIENLKRSSIGDDKIASESFQRFESRIAQQEKAVEELKRHRSNASNSERYLPRLLDEARQKLPGDPLPDEVEHKLLAWRFVNDVPSRDAVAALKPRLEQRPDLPELAAHVNVLYGAEQQLQELTLKTLNAGFAEDAETLAEVESAVLRKRADDDGAWRFALLVAALALAVLALWLPARP